MGQGLSTLTCDADTLCLSVLPFLAPKPLRLKPQRFRPRLVPIAEVEEEAFVEEIANDVAQRQREHQQRRLSSLHARNSAALDAGSVTRQKSGVDDLNLQGWADYRANPTSMFGSEGLSEVGVQRIDLPFGASELERVAAWLDDVSQSGMAPLRPLHRLDTPERLGAWKERFDSLDLGEYDALRAAAQEATATTTSADMAGAEHLASLRWSVLLIEPNRFFQCRKHPNVEVIFCAYATPHRHTPMRHRHTRPRAPSAHGCASHALSYPLSHEPLASRGAVYENRVLASALLNAPREDHSELIDSGFPKFFRVNQHAGGATFDHPRYSVDQSYTLDEGAVLLVLWAGKHIPLADPDDLMWDPSRCQNPLCALACPDRTFEALASHSAHLSLSREDRLASG
jgi:hypothetical protein